MSENAPFLVERAGGVLKLSFNTPDRGNVLPQEAVPALADLFASIGADRSVRAVLIRGGGKNFSAGGDVGSFLRALDQTVETRRADFAARLDAVRAMVETFLAIEVPIVASCQGAVAGAGLLFALGADHVVADETVAFLFSHQRVGLPPDGGVSYLLPRIVGRRHAARLVLTAARVGADEALTLGLASEVVPAGDREGRASAAVDRFARAPADVVRQAKRLLALSGALPLADHLAAERDAIVEAVGGADFEEGVRAFLEKRPAVFPSAASAT